MPTRYTCLTCGKITDYPDGCSAHRPKNKGSRSPLRSRVDQKRFRRAVLKRDGYRCTNCGSTQDLRACHIIPFAAFLDPTKAWDVSNGVTRCGPCDRQSDPYAR